MTVLFGCERSLKMTIQAYSLVLNIFQVGEGGTGERGGVGEGRANRAAGRQHTRGVWWSGGRLPHDKHRAGRAVSRSGDSNNGVETNSIEDLY